MGKHERARVAAELKNALFTIMEARGVISHTKDIATCAYFLDHLVDVLLVRDQAYHVLLEAILKGDFYLHSDEHMRGLGIPLYGNTMFIPDYSLREVKGAVTIERDDSKSGYTIRRKTPK